MGKKKIIMFALMGMIIVSSAICVNARTLIANFNGGLVTYTLDKTVPIIGHTSGVATTGYDNPGYVQSVAVFGYDSSGSVVSSDVNSSASSAYAATKAKMGVKKYTSTHIIKDATNVPLKKYTLEVE